MELTYTPSPALASVRALNKTKERLMQALPFISRKLQKEKYDFYYISKLNQNDSTFLKLKEKKRGGGGDRKRKGGLENGVKREEAAKLIAGNAGQQINIAQIAIHTGCDLLQPRQ